MEHEGEYLLAEVLLAVLPVLAAVHKDVEFPTVRYLYNKKEMSFKNLQRQ